jgi:serine/threonine protein phosphatase PrpC
VHASFENRCLHERVTIEKGERLLLYTDGITEAADEREEFYDVHFPLQRTS